MGLATLVASIKWILGLWLAIVGLVLLYRMTSGKMLLTGLLRVTAQAPFGFDRIQLVFVTVAFAAGYAMAALATTPGKAMPNIPTPLLLVLIGSQGTYLAVKFATRTGGAGRGK